MNSLNSAFAKLIPARETWSLRQKILRPGQPIEVAKYPTDPDPTNFHVGVFLNGFTPTKTSGRINYQANTPVADQLVCVATFLPELAPEKFRTISIELASAKNSFRLRGMATDAEFQGRGYGRIALEFSFEKLVQRQCDILWCNAREIAFPFYERLGFSYVGDRFDIAGIGPHKVMLKSLLYNRTL